MQRPSRRQVLVAGLVGVAVGAGVLAVPATQQARALAALFLFVLAAGGTLLQSMLRAHIGRFAAHAATGIYCAVLLTAVLVAEQRPLAEYPAVWLTGLLLPFLPAVFLAPFRFARLVYRSVATRGSRRLGRWRPRRTDRAARRGVTVDQADA